MYYLQKNVTEDLTCVLLEAIYWTQNMW